MVVFLPKLPTHPIYILKRHFLQEQELRARNNALEIELRKIKASLQRQNNSNNDGDGEEDPELENLKRQLADFKLHQTELIKSMEEEYV